MRNTPTAFVPAHKQTAEEHKPGQVINPLGFRDVTLEDYISRKQRYAALDAVAQEKKMTFDEWFTKNWDWSRPLHREDIEGVWEAAQENK